MKKKKIKIIIVLTCISLITSFSMYEIVANARKPIHSGDHVFDPLRYAKQKLKNAELVKVVQNHIEIINNQITNLTSLNKNFLTIFNLNIKKNTTYIKQAHLENEGALSKDTTSKFVLDKNFKLLNDDEFEQGDFVTEGHQRRLFLNNTYKDAFRTSNYILKNFKTNTNQIQNIQQQIELAEGNLALQQLKNSQQAKQLENKIATIQLETNLSTIKRMKLQTLLEEEEYSRRRGHSLQQVSIDPYNMTSEETARSTKKPSQGFIKFQ